MLFSHSYVSISLHLIWQEGEVVPLSASVQLSVAVESWLSQLSESMIASLKGLLSQCVEQGAAVDPTRFPSQVLCLAEQIRFTKLVETAITRNTLPSVLKQLQVCRGNDT